LSQLLEEAAREKLDEVTKKAYNGLIAGYKATAADMKKVLKIVKRMTQCCLNRQKPHRP
jgi:hypothetical protein